MPMSGSYSTDGDYMAQLVKEQGYKPKSSLFLLHLVVMILLTAHLDHKLWQWKMHLIIHFVLEHLNRMEI